MQANYVAARILPFLYFGAGMSNKCTTMRREEKNVLCFGYVFPEPRNE